MSKRFKKVYVEITNVCNLKCDFCPQNHRPSRFMSVSEFQRVVQQLDSYTDYLYFHLMGEPLLHPALSELFACCAFYKKQVNLTTNGTCISGVKDILLTANSLRKIGFSLHSYEANQENISLKEYLTNIYEFSQQARQQGILVEFRLWNQDAERKMGRNLLNPEILSYLREWYPSLSEEQVLQKGSIKLEDHLYLSLAEIFDWPDQKRTDTKEQIFCYGLRDHLGVLCDGTVVPCCLDSQGDIPLGNLYQQTLEEILETQRAKAIYEGFSRRQAVETLCQKCGYARRF